MKHLKMIGVKQFPVKQQVRVQIERPRNVKDKNISVGMKVYTDNEGKLVALNKLTKSKKYRLVGVILDTGVVPSNHKFCPSCKEVLCTCCGKCHNRSCDKYMQAQTFLELLEERYPLVEMTL